MTRGIMRRDSPAVDSTSMQEMDSKQLSVKLELY
jgi:hypothetical protein